MLEAELINKSVLETSKVVQDTLFYAEEYYANKRRKCCGVFLNENATPKNLIGLYCSNFLAAIVITI